jgi:2-polyprenyl-6-hydroxyphenyl methylase/3-demethylubiquinone-9 3-methyltransferase
VDLGPLLPVRTAATLHYCFHEAAIRPRGGYDVGVGEALPYEDASFDPVVCVDVLEHAADLNKVLSEFTLSLPVTAILNMGTARKLVLGALA